MPVNELDVPEFLSAAKDPDTNFDRSPTPEREVDRIFSIYRSAQRRLEMEALRGGPAINVSGYRNADFDTIPFEKTAADHLVDRIIRRQHQADIVARNVRKAQRLLTEARRDFVPQQWSTAHVNKSRVGRFDFPRTVFGTEAWISQTPRPRINRGFGLKFTSPTLALPCIERMVRREVLFAKRKAGKGYRKRHRMTLNSLLGC